MYAIKMHDRGYIKIVPILFLKVKNDHRNKFSNSSNWKEEAWKIRASVGFEPVTSALPVRCSTNWAMKPNIGSEVLIHMFTWEMKGAQCREAVLVNFWCHFEEILISTFSIAVSQNQVVCGVYMYICTPFCSVAIPLMSPSEMIDCSQNSLEYLTSLTI